MPSDTLSGAEQFRLFVSVPGREVARTRHTVVRSVIITPELAAHILEFYPFSRNRKPRENKVRDYARDMIEGKFHRPESAMVFGHVSGDSGIYPINGNHRLLAIVVSGVSIEMTVESRAFPNMAALIEEYNRIDSGIVRTAADHYHSGGIAAQYEMSATSVKNAVAALRVIGNNFAHVGPNSMALQNTKALPDQIAVLDNWIDVIREYMEASGAGAATVSRGMQSAQVMSVGLVTYKFAPETARVFWPSVRAPIGWRDSVGSRVDPRSKLREILEERAGNARKNRDPEAVSRSVIACWNSYCADLLMLRASGVIGAHIDITGTPWRRYSQPDPLEIVGIRPNRPLIVVPTSNGGEQTVRGLLNLQAQRIEAMAETGPGLGV